MFFIQLEGWGVGQGKGGGSQSGDGASRMIAHDDAVRPSDRPGGFDQENNRPTDGAWSKVGDNRCAWKKVSIPKILVRK